MTPTPLHIKPAAAALSELQNYDPKTIDETPVEQRGAGSDMDSKNAIELWCDIPRWQLRRFFGEVVGEAELSSEEAMGGYAEEARCVAEKGLEPDWRAM